MELATQNAGTMFGRATPSFACDDEAGDGTFARRDQGPQRAAIRCGVCDQTVWFARIVDEWLQSRPAPLVSALVAGSRLSLRQLERKCNALYGKSPKVLAREARALRAASEIALNPHAGYDVVEFGFYDQAHMIREIKHFTGTTPGRIRAATWGSAVGLAALSDQTPSLATVSAKYVP